MTLEKLHGDFYRHKMSKSESSSETYCLICNSGHDEHVLLLCDGCDRAFHTYCINLKNVPRWSWYCNGCLMNKEKKNKKEQIFSPIKVSKKKLQEPESETETESKTESDSDSVVRPRKTKKIVHIYVRVSTKGQNEPKYGRVGQDTQLDTIKNFCKKNNYYVKSTTTEVGSAYKTKKTPLLDTLVKNLKKDEILVVYSADRFSRNVCKASKNLDLVHKNGSVVFSVKENKKSTDKEFLQKIKEGENYSKMIGQRVKDSTKKIKAKGGFTGHKKPFGFNIIRHNGLRMLQKNPIEQKIIEDIKQMIKNLSVSVNSFLTKDEFLEARDKLVANISNKYNKYEWSDKIFHDICNDTISKKYTIVDVSDNSDKKSYKSDNDKKIDNDNSDKKSDNSDKKSDKSESDLEII